MRFCLGYKLFFFLIEDLERDFFFPLRVKNIEDIEPIEKEYFLSILMPVNYFRHNLHRGIFYLAALF